MERRRLFEQLELGGCREWRVLKIHPNPHAARLELKQGKHSLNTALTVVFPPVHGDSLFDGFLLIVSTIKLTLWESRWEFIHF